MSGSATQTVPSITVGGPEYAVRVGEVLAAAFSSQIFTAYTLRSADSTWKSTQIPSHIIQPHFQHIAAEKASLGAEFVEAGNWAAVAIWFPPGFTSPPTQNIDPRVAEYRERFAEVKKRVLQGRSYWYLNLIGRHPERSDPGVVRVLIDPYLRKAREAGVPVWLEAISDHGRQVYEHLSFRTAAEVRLGAGRVNGDGELDAHGEGLVVYGMIAE